VKLMPLGSHNQPFRSVERWPSCSITPPGRVTLPKSLLAPRVEVEPMNSGAGSGCLDQSGAYRNLKELEGAVIGEQRITAPVHRGSQMDRIRRLQAGGSAQLRGSLHHLRMQRHHAAVGEKAAEGEETDLIG